MNLAIKVENLSKQYKLGTIGTGSLVHDVNKWWHRLLGKENPYLKIGEENNRAVTGESEYVWALKDINFEVQQGEVLGIIGRNGAGKSTLLKILSRTTAPTTGDVKIKGRIASLLEVGTGFHPELTGRENVFLNGAIMGMKKNEIKAKFDEIVDFAGVERYIDTPVKRYSSGMYVRLAFGVAAHLEPEILVVDEVLAVGDAEFQKKALGKMKDVSNKHGRTVLFVSHNIAAIRNLCNTCMLLNKGGIELLDKSEIVVNNYLENNFTINKKYEHKEGNLKLEIADVLINDSKLAVIKIFEEIKILIRYKINEKPVMHCEFFILISNSEGEHLTSFFQADDNFFTNSEDLTGIKKLSTSCLLVPGKYYISVGIFNNKREFYDWVEYCESFIVEEFYEDKRQYRPRLGISIGTGKWEN